jgi:uncharacterized protein YrrD
VNEPASWLVIEPGWTVETSDGQEVGTVHEVLGDEDADIFDGLAVSPGLLKRARYVPSESVAEIRQGHVVLSLSAEAFEQRPEYKPT